MVEETQDHIHSLGISCSHLTSDQRHSESSKYPFLDYDILSDDGDDNIKPLCEYNSQDHTPLYIYAGSFQPTIWTPLSRQMQQSL
jgi:hypothetical protein